MTDSDVALFLTQFANTYYKNCANDAFKKFRGNLVDRLNKKNPPLSDVEKIYEIVQHAQKEPSGRTNQALKAILPQFAVRSDPVVRDETTAVSSRDEGSASNGPQVLLNSTTQPDVAAIEKAIQKAKKAKKILDAALSDFKKSVYLFGESSINNVIKRGQDQAEIVASYLFLKAAGETEAVAQYDKQLKEVIYPNYLRYALRPAAERNGTSKFRYNLAEELFICSGVVHEARRLAVESDCRNEVSGGAGFFARKESSSKEVFENSCLKRWANIPLFGLKQAGFVDSVIFDAVQEKMASVAVNDQNRLCIERIFYLNELIKREKFDDAIREAKAIKATYGDLLKNQPKLSVMLNEALNDAVTEIKRRIVMESKKMLAEHKPDPDNLLGKDHNHLSNKIDSICGVRNAALTELTDIFTAINSSCLFMKSDINAMCSAIQHGVTNTYALKTIAESVLVNQPFDHQLLLALDPETARNYYSVVWVCEEHEKAALSKQLQTAITAEAAENGRNSSRRELLQGLRNCIGSINPVDELLKTPLTISNVTTKIRHEDVVLMHRGAIGTQYVMQLLEKAFEPLWKYGPIQKAITHNADGSMTFADPKDPNTKNLIDKSVMSILHFSNPMINFQKYEFVIALHGALSTFRKNLSHDDITPDKNYHEKITENFKGLITSLGVVREQIRESGEQGKTFDKLILDEEKQTGVLAAVTEAQSKWIKYCAGMTTDSNLSQHREKPRAFYETPQYAF